MKKSLIVALSVTAGVLVGSVILPALAEPIYPSSSPTPSLTVEPTPTVTAPPVAPAKPKATPAPEPSATLDVTAIAKGHIWFQIAQLWSQLCAGQDDLFSLEMKVAHYQATNQVDIASHYQSLLTAKQAFITATKQKVATLTTSLANPPAFASADDATTTMNDDLAQLDSMMATAEAGRDRVDGLGITDDVWVAEIDALQHAQELLQN